MPFLFAAVYRKYAVILNFGHKFGVVGIHRVRTLFVVFYHLHLYFAVIFKERPQFFAQLGIIRNYFGYDIASSRYGRSDVFDTLFGVDIFLRLCIGVTVLLQNEFGKRL